MRDICILTILAFLLIIIPVGLYYDFLLNHQSQSLYVVEIPFETVKPNKCIFGLFTEYFKVSNSPYIYYPSCFSPIKIRTVQVFESFSLLEYIRQEQDVIFINYIKPIFDNLGDLTKLSN